MNNRPTIHILIRPLPDAVPWESRVKRWLKAGLRTYGLQCTLATPAREGAPLTFPTPTPVQRIAESLPSVAATRNDSQPIEVF